MAVAFIRKGLSLIPIGRHQNAFAAEFNEDTVYTLDVVPEPRTAQSHRHYFALVKEYWLNLPEGAAMEPWARTEEHLRKYALIKTGWNTCEVLPCGTAAEARRWAAHAARLTDEFTITIPRGSTVEIYRARSQKYREMRKPDFQASKDAVLGFLEQIVGARVEEPAA